MKLKTILALLAALATPTWAATGSRIKELASWEGVRDNQLIGYGLVVGLAGTGDQRQTMFSAQSLTNMLERMGVSVSPTAIRVMNTAAVMVTATLPPFAQPGTRIDVTAASMGDAKNLQGGLLLLTPLRAPNGQVFAAAQGAVVTGGFMAGRGGNSQTVNHPTVGRIVAGALVEQAAPSTPPSDHLRLQLRRADFATASHVAQAVNKQFPANPNPVARAENSAAIAIETPPSYANRPVEFMAQIEALVVEAERAAKIVVNERTGTVVAGREVRIAPVSVLQGNLSVEIQTSFAVSQPNALSSGETAVVPQIGVTAKEERARNIVLKEGATVDDLVRALISIGSTPRDIIAILQNLRAAGALDAELEVL